MLLCYNNIYGCQNTRYLYHLGLAACTIVVPHLPNINTFTARSAYTNLAGARLAVVAYPAKVVVAQLSVLGDRGFGSAVACVRRELVRRPPQDAHLRFDHLVLNMPETTVSPVCKTT